MYCCSLSEVSKRSQPPQEPPRCFPPSSRTRNERCSPSSSSSSWPAWSAARSPARSRATAGSRPGTRARPARRRGSSRPPARRPPPASSPSSTTPRAPPKSLLNSSASPGSPRSRHPAPSRDGRSASVAATLRADADEEEVAAALEERYGDDRDVALGGGAVAGSQVGDERVRGSRPRRAARLPRAPAALAAVLPRPRDGAAAGGRDDDGARHVPRADRGQPGVRALDLRAEPRDRARARAGDRLHAVPGHPLPRGTRQGATRTRSARPCAPPAAPSSSAP